MAGSFTLEIVTPYRRLFSMEVEEMTAPGALGEFGVLAGHTPLITILTAGVLSYKSGGAVGRIAIGRGYAEVTHKKTTILVENADAEAEIDLAEASDGLREAEEALKGIDPDDPAYAPALEAFELQKARVNVKERHGGGKTH